MDFVRNSRMNVLLAAGLVVSLGAAAKAQLVTVSAQNRFIEGTTVSTNDGQVTTVGPFRDEAPSGDFSTWAGTLTVPGNMVVGGMQTGGFDGSATFELTSWNMNWSGGGGPGSEGSGTLTNTYGYTFDVHQAATFTLDGFFGGSDAYVTFSLSGPGVSISDTNTPNNVVQYQGVTGSMSPGTYTLRLQGTGTISFVGPGGNGGGAGGQQPLVRLAIAQAVCRADFNGVGGVTVQDIFDFLSAYFAGSSAADFNGVGGVTVQDIFDFLAAYFAGC